MEIDGGGGGIRRAAVGMSGGGEWDESSLWWEVFDTEFAVARSGGGMDSGSGGEGFGSEW